MDIPSSQWVRIFDAINDGVMLVDLQGNILGANRAMKDLLGKPVGEPLSGPCWELVNSIYCTSDGFPLQRMLQTNRRESLLLQHNGRWLNVIVDPLTEESGRIIGGVQIVTDVTDHKLWESALEERLKLASLTANIFLNLNTAAPVPEMLQKCAEIMVQSLDAAFARIWTINDAGDFLDLQASAGMYTHLDGPHGRIPLNRDIKIPNIARTRQPHLTNQVLGDPQVGDQEWVKREGMVSFAGYPLIVQDRLKGVMGLFARHPLTEFVLKAMANVADSVALAIEQRRAEDALLLSEKRFRTLVETAPSVIIGLTPDHRIIEFNPEAERLYGMSSSEALGQNYFELFLPQELWKPTASEIKKVLAGQPVRGFVNLVRGHDGREHIMSWDANPLLDAAGQPAAALAIGQDITERKRAQERQAVQFAISKALAESSTLLEAGPRFLRAVCEELKFDVGELWLVDHESNLLRRQALWSQPFSLPSNFIFPVEVRTFSSGEGLPGEVWASIQPVWIDNLADDPRFLRKSLMAQAGLRGGCAFPILLGREVIGVIALFAKELRHPDEHLNKQMDDLGHQMGQFIQRRRAEDKLLHLSLYDGLTGLANSALLRDRLQMTLNKGRSSPGHTFAVLFINVDRFQKINDTLGHGVGDQLLIDIARRLEECVRPEDTVARFSADNFIILLANVKEDRQAIVVAGRIRQCLHPCFHLAGHEVFVTVSLGIAMGAGDYETPDEILRDADLAMNRAKDLGKDRFFLYDPAMRGPSVEAFSLERDLRWALERQELLLHYQPLVELASGRLTGFEALVRWNHPERGLVMPGEFIPLAEETGLILPLGQWVLREACTRMQAWQTRFQPDPPLTISVNLSARQFTQPDLVELVAQTLQGTGLPGTQLRLEITETAVMYDPEAAIRMLTALKDLGVRLSIDDFGTGHASLRYLQRLPVDSLKIDYSFISKLKVSPESATIVKAILGLAGNLGLRVVAEGIETAGELHLLQKWGCGYGQGFYFFRPMDQEAAAALIAAGEKPLL
ncbi:MAG: EAL domain-containing protein [Desulfobaccales bacterium]